MIRVLILIAVAGFLVSAVTISAAVGIAGPEAIARGAWSWGDGHWGHDRWSFDDDDDGHPTGPQATRELAWTGGDTFDVDVPANVRYTQAPGAAKLTITGAKSAVDAVELVDGHLRYRNWNHGNRHHRRHWSGSRLNIVMTAPSVNRFDLQGSSRLTIEGYKQDTLRLDISGNAEVTVSGEARSVDVDISGSAETNLTNLKVQDAKVDIAGSGEAIIAPTESAELDISGSGDVTLLTHPARVESDISGSGEVHQSSGHEAAAPTPPALPAKPAAKPART